MEGGVLGVLRDELVRARAAGVTFDDAWPGALQRALTAARSSYERTQWNVALNATRSAWFGAYLGASDARVERVLAVRRQAERATLKARRERGRRARRQGESTAK